MNDCYEGNAVSQRMAGVEFRYVQPSLRANDLTASTLQGAIALWICLLSVGEDSVRFD